MCRKWFLEGLNELSSRTPHIVFSINGDLPCPSFELTDSTGAMAPVKGYYCESGDSFIQVSFSGREEFTKRKVGAKRFLDLIRDILYVLKSKGCLEKQ